MHVVLNGMKKLGLDLAVAPPGKQAAAAVGRFH